jgi:hypothetical protein
MAGWGPQGDPGGEPLRFTLLGLLGLSTFLSSVVIVSNHCRGTGASAEGGGGVGVGAPEPVARLSHRHPPASEAAAGRRSTSGGVEEVHDHDRDRPRRHGMRARASSESRPARHMRILVRHSRAARFATDVLAVIVFISALIGYIGASEYRMGGEIVQERACDLENLATVDRLLDAGDDDLIAAENGFNTNPFFIAHLPTRTVPTTAPHRIVSLQGRDGETVSSIHTTSLGPAIATVVLAALALGVEAHVSHITMIVLLRMRRRAAAGTAGVRGRSGRPSSSPVEGDGEGGGAGSGGHARGGADASAAPPRKREAWCLGPLFIHAYAWLFLVFPLLALAVPAQVAIARGHAGGVGRRDLSVVLQVVLGFYGLAKLVLLGLAARISCITAPPPLPLPSPPLSSSPPPAFGSVQAAAAAQEERGSSPGGGGQSWSDSPAARSALRRFSRRAAVYTALTGAFFVYLWVVLLSYPERLMPPLVRDRT